MVITRKKAKKHHTVSKAILSNADKKEVLSVYVNKLVKQKLFSKHKQNRLGKEDYERMLQKIHSMGLTWITLSGLKFRVLRSYSDIKKKSPPPPSNNDDHVTSSSNNEDIIRPYGRPKGTTNINKIINKALETSAEKKITQKYYQKMIDSDNNSNRLTNGTYDEVVEEVKREMNLPSSFYFSYQGCMNRIYRGKKDDDCNNYPSPLRDIEEKFVSIILALSDIGCPVTVGETLNLLQSLIEGTKYQRKLIDYQKKHHHQIFNKFSSAPLGKISRNYYYGFMKRHKEIIESNKGKRFEALRTKWLNYRNFAHMFDDLEKIMIVARVATRLPSPAYMNSTGDLVDDVEQAYGCKVTVSLNLPQFCIVMDEVGGDINMINDGHSGGTKYLSRKGDTPNINSTKKKKKFTVLGLTTLDGQPVMCVLIMEGKDHNVFVELGIDPFHPLYDQYQGDIASSNFSIFEDNYGPGNLFPGGPVCNFEGKTIPTMIRYSERGSITNEILTDILCTLDDLKVFQPYREQGAVPFIKPDSLRFS